MIFIKGDEDTVGGIESHIDEHHMKLMDKNSKIIVPCCDLMDVLDKIKIYHIDFFSLDVEGAEMAVLESLRDGLESSRFTVDVWSIEYRVWDGKHVVYEKSIDNLRSLRSTSMILEAIVSIPNCLMMKTSVMDMHWMWCL